MKKDPEKKKSDQTKRKKIRKIMASGIRQRWLKNILSLVTALMIPRGMEMTVATIIEAPASHSVYGKRAAKDSHTGLMVVYEVPRSP